jgi:SAM-dependent methyltransferase
MAGQLLKNKFKTVSITVVDYNETLTPNNDPRISLEHYRTLDSIPPGLFDFVMASAVIEHIPHPRLILDRLSDLLRNEGIIYFRTPYAQPFLKISNFLKLNLIDFSFPGHVHDLGMDFWESGFVKVLYPNEFKILGSNPSLVETSFKDSFFRTLTAYLLKSPWYLFGNSYKLVGGWEIFLQKTGASNKLEPPQST